LKASAGFVGLVLSAGTAIAGEQVPVSTGADHERKMIGLLTRWGDDADRLATTTMWEVFEGPDGTLRPGEVNLMAKPDKTV
jgi:hypothetical protein